MNCEICGKHATVLLNGSPMCQGHLTIAVGLYYENVKSVEVTMREAPHAKP